ncbi:ABC transporter permease [Pseudonocardia alaniniphila]|uniref:Transport permease protein n=1 Tax=Pseudonocardia alaniniphila TaxID=75291 RepID=A0ABS9TTD7_9PSEU|nr:ABC transporter permease [Pseudonocardia alaniniphila]MCH6171822.1 ABC transporter permease [Pseudonocardia alaniniphila]
MTTTPTITTAPATALSPAHGGVTNALSDASTLIGRNVRLARRNLDTLIVSIALPLLMMLLFVYVFGGAIETGTEYINYVVPGIVLLCTGYGAANTAMSVAADRASGMVDRLRSLPIRSSAMLTGHVTASVLRNAVSTTIVVLAAVAMGFRPTGSFTDWVLAAGLVLLYVLALSWVAAGIGLIAKSVESASVLGFVMLFLPYLSSAFVPTATMPWILRAVSENQPITPVIETVRGLLTGTPIGAQGWVALAWTVGILAVAATGSTWLYRRRNLT